MLLLLLMLLFNKYNYCIFVLLDHWRPNKAVCTIRQREVFYGVMSSGDYCYIIEHKKCTHSYNFKM